MLSVLRNRDFFFLEANAFFSILAAEILTVALGWRIYEMSNDAFALGLVGLAQFVPTPLLVMLTGTFADRYSRRRIITICMAVEFAAMAGIAWVTQLPGSDIWPILALLVLLGAGRAFLAPASRALAPTLVAREEIGAAVSCSTAIWQFCSISGPALGGLLYGVSPMTAYGTALFMVALAALATLFIRPVPQTPLQEESMVDALMGGLRYMKAEKIVLGATTLDLFAVLLGTTVGLLPIFARDILLADALELGVLRSAIGIGALGMALFLGIFPVRRHAGRIMFATVAVFGLGTIIFGLSHSLYLSVGALIVMGASDMISVYIREVLLQLWTPDQLRGRVTAVNSVAISASNELGTFRAGASADLFGPVIATVLGGVCTLGVTLMWMYLFPRLRKADHLTGIEADDGTAKEG
ncbi:MFS transporter [Dongia sp.]|uniref:MFS transporter n=1 Tax=Dongia sp. TaxID=1977262 RepID=UPI0035AF2BA1